MADKPFYGMTDEMPRFQDQPADSLPQAEAEPQIDEQDLSSYILELFSNDIRDKEEFGWVEKRQYDIKAYYGLKDETLSNWPWKGSSNFPVPITPTLLDTAVANIKASMYSNADKIVTVSGVGVEDVRKAPLLESILNWQLLNEIDMYSVQDANLFRTFLHGTGTVKVYQDLKRNTVRASSIDIENIFVPIDAKGFQVEDTDHVFHVIPLSYNDVQFRKSLGIYKRMDEMAPGVGINSDVSTEVLTQMKDQATGTALHQRMRRETYFLLEAWLTYYPKNASGPNGPTRAGAKPQELTVWISPNGGRIQRIAKNHDKIRPFADYHVYPNPGRFYSMSLPEKIRNIQEKADYADKQNTDALDRAISPAAFVDETSAFNPNVAQRVPGGIYPKGRGITIEYEPIPPVERGFERQLYELWAQAERMTGLIDLAQGANTSGSRTLGEQQIRSTRADIRFSTIFDRIENGFKKTVDLFYHLDNKFMPRDKKVKVLGYADYKTIDELFPTDEPSQMGLGITGKFDFAFGGAAITELEKAKEDMKAWCASQYQNPLVVSNEANLWRVTQKEAEAYGIRNVETIITKPSSVNVMSPEEAIQRILSGQYDLQPRPGIDTEGYIFEIQLFMRSEGFARAEPKCQQAMARLLIRVEAMRKAEMQALADLQMIQQGAQMAAVASTMQAEQEQPQEMPLQ